MEILPASHALGLFLLFSWYGVSMNTRWPLLAALFFLLHASIIAVRKSKPIPKDILSLMALCMMASLSCMLFSTRPELGLFAMIPISFLSALLFLLFPVPRLYPGLVLILVFAFYAYHVAVGSDPNEIFPEMSRNGASILSICATVLYYAQPPKADHHPPLWPAFLNALTCFLTLGRSGIITSALILVVVLLEGARKNRTRLIFLTGLATLGCAAVILPFFIPSINDRIRFSYLVSKAYANDPRSRFWHEYVSQLDTLSTFFGLNLRTDRFFSSEWNGNPHNSWMGAHAILGWGLLPLVACWLRGATRLALAKDWRVWLLIIFTFRTLTDRFIFFGPFDIVLLVLCFLDPIQETQERGALH